MFRQLVFVCLIISLVIPSELGAVQDDFDKSRSTRVDEGLQVSYKAIQLRAQDALQVIRHWASRFGRDIYHGTQEATCFRSIRDQFDPAKSDPSRRGDYKASVESIEWTKRHGEMVKTISTTMRWHEDAVRRIAERSEDLAGNHTFMKGSCANSSENCYPYIDVHRLKNAEELDLPEGMTDLSATANMSDTGSPEPINPEAGLAEPIDSGVADMSVLPSDGAITNEPSMMIESLPTPARIQSAAAAPGGADSEGGSIWQTPIKYLKLGKHPNFDVLINTDESAVHVPVHIYPGESQVINGIAWSDELTKVFRDNFALNRRLTNQYFASQYGFMRLFPAQQWQIPRSDPDLYDARVRPWYVAAASSRKDVVILVDSSGSMTGSRRDIAKGVAFEILDTLTDNDHFAILKFSGTVEQVGVPECQRMRIERNGSSVPSKNTVFQAPDERNRPLAENETDVDSFYMLPATGRNIRHVKANFTIPTSGIANFSRALVSAFEILHKYNQTQFGSQCNQAIMLITDGSPSGFEELFNRYNYPNSPVRIFTYLIGRDAGDVTHTKMMACHNRGYYTHVINLAEVRETVQQYIPVMARPLVLSGAHPIVWTAAYGDLTYQLLTDWVWESKRRDRMRTLAVAAAAASGGSEQRQAAASSGYVPEISYTSGDESVGATSGLYPPDDEHYDISLEEEMDAIDLFGYNANTRCFWQTRRNDLLTTVVHPVYDRKKESVVTEKRLIKSVWSTRETVMQTAQLLGVAAADMKINDIIGLAPSHKLGSNGYAILLTNNGAVMHHPDLRSVLEPLSLDSSERNMRILKPDFSSMDFTQVEHVAHDSLDANLVKLREEAVMGKTGIGELLTKRAYDCQKRVQTRRQSFYYQALEQYPFSFMIAIPQPYGSYRLEAQVEIKNPGLPEKLTTYFITSDYDIWTVHPDYQYCSGPANNTVATLLDAFQRIEARRVDDIQWPSAESSKPPVILPGKILCDQDLVQSLVYDAVATFGFSESCGPPANANAESNLLSMLGVRFSFLATRSGLTRVRHHESDDLQIKKEALAFARRHARTVDETYYSRTVDYNMLVDINATLLQVPFNTHEKIRDRFARYERQLARAQMQQSGATAGDEAPLESSSPSAGSDVPLGSPSLGGNVASSEDPTSNAGAPPAPRRRVEQMGLFERLELLSKSSLHLIASQSIVVNEGAQRAVAGVTGTFYDYATFVMRFFNLTNSNLDDGWRSGAAQPANCYAESANDEACDEFLTRVRCGLTNDTVDCLLIDNNGYIIISEHLDFIGRHVKAYEPAIMARLVQAGVFREISVTDHQAVCLRHDERHVQSSALARLWRGALPSLARLAGNALASGAHLWTLVSALVQPSWGAEFGDAASQTGPGRQQQQLAILANKTYLRPCKKQLTLYENHPDWSRPAAGPGRPRDVEHFASRCGCPGWFVFEQVPQTNTMLLIVDSAKDCPDSQGCDGANRSPAAAAAAASQAAADPTDPVEASPPEGGEEQGACANFERESHLFRRRPDSCYCHHKDEINIKLCGGASSLAMAANGALLTLIVLVDTSLLFWHHQSGGSL